MSEELIQRDLVKSPEKIGIWNFYNIGSTSISALKRAGIISNRSYGAKVERKKLDALIMHGKKVISIVEYKTPAEFRTKKQREKAIAQEMEVAKAIDAKIYIATDGHNTLWVNVLTGNYIKDEKGNQLTLSFDPKSDDTAKVIGDVYQSIDEDNDKIKQPELVNPTKLARSIWQDIWSVSGATPENCLYTFVELFIFKYLSDLKILNQGINFSHLMERFDYQADDPKDQALEYYASTIRPQIKTLFPEGSDGTTIINGTIFVSKDQKAVKGYSTVFKKVLDKFDAYPKLENIDHDFKSQLFESFLKESISKKNWGQFFTPMKVVNAITVMAKDEIKPGVKICDPACGVGKFLLEPIAGNIKDFFSVDGDKVISNIELHGFDKGFDKDEQKTIILAKANMLIYFSDLIKNNPSITKDFSDLFNNTFKLKTNSILGTLSETVENEYDLILTNPPYVTSGSSNLKEEIRKDLQLVEYYKVNAMGVEGLFMEWIVKALKCGGKAFIVVPDGLFNRKNDKLLRQFIVDNCYIDGIISLPIKTFFTTPKKTYILCLTKKNDPSIPQKDPVFTYLVSEIGESRDVYRFEIENDDLSEAAILYTLFKGNKSNFNKINHDARCKLFDFSKFDPEDNWCIERWWTEQEKIELGINDSSNTTMSLEELPSFIGEISDSLNSFKDELVGDPLTSNQTCYITVNIGSIFDLTAKTNSSKFTKTFIEQNKGTVPVYSASKFPDSVDYGYVKDNIEGIKYFEDCLTWNIDGSIGKAHYRSGRFSLSEKVIPLIVKDEYSDQLDIRYLKYTIENEFRKQGFGFSNKAGKSKISPIEINVPCDKDKKPDLKLQSLIADKHESIDQIKSSMEKELAKLEGVTISI